MTENDNAAVEQAEKEERPAFDRERAEAAVDRKSVV